MTWIHLGEAAAMGTAVLWTLSALAWTSAGRHIGALAVSFLRLAIACLFLAAYGGLVSGHWLPTDAGIDTWTILAVSGFFGFFLADLCMIKAFLLIGPRLTLLILSLTPPLSAVIAWLFLGDDLLLRQWLAMGITLLGVAWVVLEEPDSPVPSQRRQAEWGILLAVLAAVGQAVGYVLSKKGIGEYDAVAATFIRVIGAMVGYVALITVWRRWATIRTAAGHAPAMLTLALGALVGPFLGVALCMVALRHCHAGVAVTIIGLMPVLILPLVILVYRERVSVRAAGGAAIAVAGVALLLM